jgi:flagellar basal-body rod protein FlgG
VSLKDLWVPLSGAIAQQRNVEVIANNVANANTAGFKRDQLSFKEYLTVLKKGAEVVDLPNKEWKPEDFYHSQGAEHAQVEIDGSFTIHEQGQLSPTGNPLDLAITGKGFFEVLTPNGIRYSRQGNFTVAPDGFLVNHRGEYVLSKVELPDPKENPDQPAEVPPAKERRIAVAQGKISINMQGEIFSNNEKVSNLSLVEFKDLHALRKEGNSNYINKDNENILKSPLKSVVNQGFIELSNVNAIEEMSKLIKANRQFESIQRVIKTYDAMSSKGVNEIAKF